jgi:hypothetical protein
MIYELPIFRQIREDARLSKRALQVWSVALGFLDVVDDRLLPSEQIEIVLDVDRTTVHRNLVTLIEEGYLVRVQRGKRDAWTFRVPASRVPKADREQLRQPSDEEPDEEGAPRRARPAKRSRIRGDSVY